MGAKKQSNLAELLHLLGEVPPAERKQALLFGLESAGLGRLPAVRGENGRVYLSLRALAQLGSFPPGGILIPDFGREGGAEA